MTNRDQSIVLIGFMGVGKSVTGKELARKTGLPRLDIDEIISAQFALPVGEIFAQFGEEKFRDCETDALRQLLGGAAAIIVTGGGIILRHDNVKLLRALGKVISLEADFDTLVARIGDGRTRPLLSTDDPRRSIEALFRVRHPLYREAADIRLDTSSLTPAEVADRILAKIRSL